MKTRPNSKAFRHFSWRLSACAVGALTVIAACGGGGSAGDINTNTTPTATQAPTNTPTPTTTTTNTPTATPSSTAIPTNTASPAPSLTATPPIVMSEAFSAIHSDLADARPLITRMLESNNDIYVWARATAGTTLNRKPDKIIKINKMTKEKVVSCIEGVMTSAGKYDCLEGNNVKSDKLSSITEQGVIYYSPDYSSSYGILSTDFISSVDFGSIQNTGDKPNIIPYIAGGDGGTLRPTTASVDGKGYFARFRKITAMSNNTYQNDLYIIDDGLLRKMNITTKEVKTVAGASGNLGKIDGIGNSARFSENEKRMFIDENGMLFMLTDNASIRQFNPNTKETSTLIERIGLDDGEGNQTSTILDITGDKKGNLYIINATQKVASNNPRSYWNSTAWDTTKFRIRKINISTKSITTIVGEGNLPIEFYQDSRRLCDLNIDIDWASNDYGITPPDAPCKKLPTFTPGPSAGFMTTATSLVYINNAIYYNQEINGAFPYAAEKIVKAYPLP